MKTLDDYRDFLLTLCRDLSVPAEQVIEHCDTLLNGPHGALNEEQQSDIDIIRQSAKGLFSLLQDIQSYADQELSPAKESGPTDQNLIQLWGQFLCNISSELKTPANSIIGFSRLSLEGKTGPLNDKQRDITGRIRELGQTIVSISNRALDFVWDRRGQ